jgi:hypothetical protein
MNRKPFVAGAVVAVLAVSGCGTSQPIRNSKADPPSHHVFVEWDETGATATDPSYREEVVDLIEHAARQHGEVLAVVLDGQPITTADIEHRDFAEPPPEGAEDTEALIESIASGFAHELLTQAARPEEVRGSGQLQGLQIAATTPGVGEIILWSDGIVNEPADHFDLSDANQQEIQTEIALWSPKLTALKNKTVVIVGVGRGVHEVITVEHAHRFFQVLVEEDAGGDLIWTPTLAQR